MTKSFKEVAGTLQRVSHRWAADISENWRQGRTVYGGLTTALALETCYKSFPDLPPLRSATINFVGPVSANPHYEANLLRQGRNVTMVEVKGFVEDQLVISVTFSFGGRRESEVSEPLPAPDAPLAERCEPFTPLQGRAFVPAFFNNFDTRLIAGGRPMSGMDKGYIRTWSRHEAEDSRDGTVSLLCLADVLPPAAMPLLRKLGPVSSMTWIVNFLTETPQTQDGWWHVESELSAGGDGYSSQVMRIWNSDGDLTVEGMQSVALFV